MRLQDGLEHDLYKQSDRMCSGQFASGQWSLNGMAGKSMESVHVI